MPEADRAVRLSPAAPRDTLFWVLYYIPWVTAALRLGLDTVPDVGLNPVTAALMAGFLLLAVFQPVLIRKYRAIVEPWLALQTLVMAALVLTPPLEDYFALLVVSVALVASRYLPPNHDVVWLVVSCVVPTVALLGAFGISVGLGYAPSYIAGVLCLGLYGRASRRAVEARERSEGLLRKLKVYAGQAEELAAAQERNRLARELHDAVTQTLFGLNLTAEAARLAAAENPAEVPPLLDRIQESSSDALAELRAIVSELRPIRLGEEGLEAALRRHLELRERRDKLRVSISVSGNERGEPEVKEALFRAIQEALNNVAKHAGVGTAEVELAFGDDAIRATVRDAGTGFDPGEASEQGFGLTTMRERVETLGGSFRLDSRAGKGTTVAVTVPLGPGEHKHEQEP